MPHVSIEEVHNAVADTTAPQLFLKLASEHPQLDALHSIARRCSGILELVDHRPSTPTRPRKPRPVSSTPGSDLGSESC